jgi:hypothetical protein
MTTGRRGGRGTSASGRGQTGPDSGKADPIGPKARSPATPATPTKPAPVVPPEWKQFDLNGDGVLDERERAALEQHRKEYAELAIPPAGTTPAPEKKSAPAQPPAPAK